MVIRTIFVYLLDADVNNSIAYFNLVCDVLSLLMWQMW